MKPLSFKTGLILSVALCLLVVGCMIRKRPTTLQRYPHEHLQTSALEPRAKLDTVNYTLRNGETLASVAKRRYGHEHYYRVIKLYNHLEDEGQIASDYALRLPEMSVILAEEGFTKVAAQEAGLILCSRAKYDKVVDQLWAARGQSTGNHVLTEGIKRELLEAADDLQQATESLKLPKPGATGLPTHMIGQLEQSMSLLKNLAAGEHWDPNGYDIDMVQQRYALALTYAIIWAREGFK